MPRRAPAITAGLVAVYLGAGADMAQTGEPAAGPSTGASSAWQAEREPAPARQDEPAPARQETSGAGAALRGRVATGGQPLADVTVVARNVFDGEESSARTAADGTFTIGRLRTGIYEIEGTHEGFTISSQRVELQAGEPSYSELVATPQETRSNVGALVVPVLNLRGAYDASDVVVAAVVGPSVVTSRRNAMVEVLTDLQVESLIKGNVPRGGILYRHAEYEPEGGEAARWSGELTRGTRVLALLERSKADPGVEGKPIFEAVDFFHGLKRLGDRERDAYVARLDALARLEQSGETNPAALAEWIVATTEDPATRGEAIGELNWALHALVSFAEAKGISTEMAAERLAASLDRFQEEGGTLRNQPPPDLLGALLTAEHRHRLTAALRATDTWRGVDLDLFRIVRRWDERAARECLLRQLRKEQPEVAADVEQQLSLLVNLAIQLADDSDALRTLAAAAVDRQKEIVDARFAADDATQPASWQEKAAALVADLRRDLLAALASSQPPRTE